MYSVPSKCTLALRSVHTRRNGSISGWVLPTTHSTLGNFSENVLHETTLKKEDKDGASAHPVDALCYYL